MCAARVTSVILTIREVRLADVDRCLELNNAATPAVPFMEHAALAALLEESDHAYGVVDGSTADAPLLGFVLAMVPGRDYSSENYRFFSRRSDSFLYIDRIVVDESIRGAGLGRLLYERAFEIARDSALREVTCEVNVQPPNPESMAFHLRMGFAEVARQATKNGSVDVALLAASVA